MFTDDATLIQMGVAYARVAFAFTTFNVLALSFEKIFQSVGKMAVTMVGMMAGCVTNIILDPMMIFGIGPFPAMGIEGAALATGIGQTVSLLIYVIVYLAKPLHATISRRYLPLKKPMAMRLYAIGIPAALNLALPSLLISCLNAILAAYSQAYVVVLGVYYKLQTFLYLPANGIIQGMRPILGYNYGAGEKKRVKAIYLDALILSAAIMAVGTGLCLLIPGKLMGMFTENVSTVEAGARALRIISAGFVISAVSVTASGALEGLGKGGPSLVISLFRYVLIIIPAAWILSRFLGPDGVWHAFWVTEVITAIVAFAVYQRAAKME